MSSNNGGSRPTSQPTLQPKPVAISPLRQPVQGVTGQPLIPRPQTQRNLVQPVRQSQFMMGTMSQSVNLSQPRMTAQVLQPQQPRMAMYVQGQMPQNNIPKIVTGVPVYQNTTNRVQNQPQMTLSLQPGNGQLLSQFQAINQIRPHLIQTGQTMATNQIRPHLIQTGQAMTGQMTYRPSGHMQTFGYTGFQVQNLQPVSTAPPAQGSQNQHQALQPKPDNSNIGQFISSSTSMTTLTPMSPQVFTSVSQIPKPTFYACTSLGSSALTPISSHYQSPQTGSTALSPLVPLSPSMFQVTRPLGQTQLFTSAANLSQISPTMLRFGTQSGTLLNSQHVSGTLLNSHNVSGALPNSQHVSSTQMNSRHVSGTLPNSQHVSGILPSSYHVSGTLLNSQHVSSTLPSSQNMSGTLLNSQHVSGTLLSSQHLPCMSTSPAQGSVQCIPCPATMTPVLTIPSLSTLNQPKDLSNKPSPLPSPAVYLANIPTSSIAENLCIKPVSPPVEIKHTSPQMDRNQQDSFQESVLNLRQNHDPDRLKSCDKTPFDKTRTEQTVPVIEQEETATPESMDIDESRSEKGDSNDDPTGTGDSDEEFIWEEYLQDIGASAVPPTAFKHVEFSLQSGFVKGMKLEVPNKSDPSTYWVASVIMTCGPLLRLRFDGYEADSSADFWCDLSTCEIHSIGWCAQNGQNLQPPEEIKYKFTDWREFLMMSLTGARTAPSFLLDKAVGSTPIDQLKPGMKLELQDSLNPLEVWLVQIIENVGGRLYLRPEGTETASKDFWMFYLNSRLHPIGWASQDGFSYKAPKDIQEQHSPSKWEEILDTALKQGADMMLPIDVFKDQVELKPHRFEVGMKLEALNPSQSIICPATVVKVFNNNYFLVEIDDLRCRETRESIQICCHSEYLGIFPITFSQCKGIRLQSPRGWNQPDFLWGEYLSFCNAKAALERLFHSGTDEHEFERGMKLEAVNPENPNQICAATITKIVGPLLWIHLDNTRDVPSHIEDIDSQNLFPVGWCESNGYQLKPPRSMSLKKARKRRSSENLHGEAFRSETYSHVKSGDEGGSWCPKIYFNHRCFSGPFLSKGRISELPKSVGPGPMGLVLKEVLSLLINVAYKSSRALKELQQEGLPNPSMQPHMMKAKYKGKSYTGVVEVCRMEAQLEEFCRNVCIKLECCPYLFSPLYVEDNCPENCQQLTKTKYNYNYGKKKKKPVGRPPSSHTNLENGPKIPAKRGRKKKKRFHLIQKKTHSNLTGQYDYRNDDVFLKGENKDEGFIDDDRSMDGDYYDDGRLTPSKKRKYVHHLPPPSDIQTRGAKLPKYSFERKTHKKILLLSSSPPMKSKDRIKSPHWLKETSPVKQHRVLLPREETLHVDTNPLYWAINDVIKFIKETDCCHLARIIKEQEIDGQALLLLNLSTIQEHLELKLGPAVKLCHQIERLKVAFFEKFA